MVMLRMPACLLVVRLVGMRVSRCASQLPLLALLKSTHWAGMPRKEGVTKWVPDMHAPEAHNEEIGVQVIYR